MPKSLFLLVLFFISVPLAYAQFDPNSSFAPVVSGPVYLDISPKEPGPNQFVTATLQSYSTDLNSATISWFVNGVLDKKGTGVKTFSFQTGDVGKTTNLRVTATTFEGAFVEKTLSVSSSEVVLFWEAEGYAPPFYRGKALYAHQGDLRVVALPRFVSSSGARINPNSLIYTWKKDGVVLQDASGFGKQTLSLTGSIISRPFTIEVTVASTDGSVKGSERTTIRSTEAKVLVYEDSPLYGIRFGKAIETVFPLAGQEASFTAIPYFFSVNNLGSAKYSWLMNSRAVGDGSATITFRNETNESGQSRVSVKAENTSKILQFGSKNFTVEFSGEENNSTFFE